MKDRQGQRLPASIGMYRVKDPEDDVPCKEKELETKNEGKKQKTVFLPCNIVDLRRLETTYIPMEWSPEREGTKTDQYIQK